MAENDLASSDLIAGDTILGEIRAADTRWDEESEGPDSTMGCARRQPGSRGPNPALILKHLEGKSRNADARHSNWGGAGL